jgi:hypothetical protein
MTRIKNEGTLKRKELIPNIYPKKKIQRLALRVFDAQRLMRRKYLVQDDAGHIEQKSCAPIESLQDRPRPPKTAQDRIARKCFTWSIGDISYLCGDNRYELEKV